MIATAPTLTTVARKAQRAAARRGHLAAQKHRALIRKGGLAGRRDVTTAPCVTDDGLAFVSIECGTDPAALAIFALQPATEGRGMIVVDHAAGAVVARGRDGAAALRSFARTLPPGATMTAG
jgi:hypothetical protein